ncbi:MAG: DUF1697 domain-containing protein [Devosia sp.]|uniref:DUF1697 domain-containing protein n=1 Tax=Devosia sp. TaxID=1871048 RepID=UPI001ACC9574|nr:DUF1697 domain-containing protein [Devosia sp.]MBN9317577.1 DUF1697 domain-containing protein [Devosia sp.]
MTVWVAFLRAVNVGKRQMKMAELKALCEELGYSGVKTILASGNVRFECGHEPKAELEAAIARRWGWSSQALIRTGDEIEAMLASTPFAAYPDEGPFHRYVMMFDKPLSNNTKFTGATGDYDIVRVDARDLFLVGWRQPDGRHGPGLDKFDRQLEKGAVATMRNWNTIPKVLE